MPDPTIAPAGEPLVQMQMPIDPETSKIDGVTGLETIVDHALPGWRQRTTHRLEPLANTWTEAVDFPAGPGETGQRLTAATASTFVGDRVVAPGLLREVSLNSGVRAF